MEDVVTCEVFGSSTDGNVGSSSENLETDFRPSSFERFEVDSSIDESLSEITSTSFEGVDTEGERTRSIRGSEEFESLDAITHQNQC